MIARTLKMILLISYTLFAALPSYGTDLISNFDALQDSSFTRYSVGNEFISGNDPGVVMMKVNLWGAVFKPGIHHIPVNTDLIGLLSYAGGPNDKAILDEVIIKRNQNGKQKKISIDLQQIIHEQKVYNLALQPDDIIVVPAKQPLLSDDTLLVTGFLATILTAVFTGVLIDQNN